jgi:hypothetical protein
MSTAHGFADEILNFAMCIPEILAEVNTLLPHRSVGLLSTRRLTETGLPRPSEFTESNSSSEIEINDIQHQKNPE